MNLIEDVYYFGCANDRAGHYLINKHGDHILDSSIMAMCDSQLLPLLPAEFPAFDRLRLSIQERGYKQPQELATLYYTILSGSEPWSLLTFWDRSVDTRYDSKSCLLAKGYLDFDQMMSLFRSSFPDILKRYPFQIRLYNYVANNPLEDGSLS